MPAIIIHDLSEEAHRTLKMRAAGHGRSIESEIRDILESVARPAQRVRLGSLLAEIGREAGGVELEIERDIPSKRPA